MHVGMGVIFQGGGEGRSDCDVYRNELGRTLGYEAYQAMSWVA